MQWAPLHQHGEENLPKGAAEPRAGTAAAGYRPLGVAQHRGRSFKKTFNCKINECSSFPTESSGSSRLRFVSLCKTGALFREHVMGRSGASPAAPVTAGERGAQQSQGEHQQPEGGGGYAKSVSMSANKDVQYRNICIYSLSSAARASPAGHLPSLAPRLGWEARQGRGHPASSRLRALGRGGGKGSATPGPPEGCASSEVLWLVKQGPWEESAAGCHSPLPSPHLWELLPRAGGMPRWDARRDAVARLQAPATRPSAGSGWALCTPVSPHHTSGAEPPSPWR